MKKIIVFVVFIAAVFYLTNFNNIVFAIDPQIKAPENFEEAKQIGEKTFNVAKSDLPGIIQNIWQNEVWPTWKKMGDYLNAWIQNIWQKLKKIFQTEFEKRQPLINEEFKKEKTELKEGLKTEVPTAGKSLWEKIKEIIR